MQHTLNNEVSLKNFNALNQMRISPVELCSYLPDRLSQLKFMVLLPHQVIASDLYTELNHQGYRRSGSAFYKPHCAHCIQCIACRVLVKEFKTGRRFRKVLNRNKNVELNIIPTSKATQEHYNLYQKYISARHADGDMYPPSLQTFEHFLLESPADTVFMEFREPTGKLIAVAVTDKLNDGLSSIYTFFDPDPSYNSRSLGVFCILKQIETALSLDLSHAYLGFWIPKLQKMSYKTEYLPIELLIDDEWQRFDENPDFEDISTLFNTKQMKLLF